MRHKIVITSGEPAGIGPDICLSLVKLKVADKQSTELYIIADTELLTERASQLNIRIKFQIHQDTNKLSRLYAPLLIMAQHWILPAQARPALAVCKKQ